ncbi:MAG: nucleotidyltransferase domain-containing protein [Candidatus Pacebacteria bacterium]|nr:nucleotidyltransferase domain-containing protein [Candidatus Paceibacterota bacterium]
MINKTKKTKRLPKIIDQIVEDIKPYNPEKVILFGSASRNGMHKNSDIDLLIVKKTRKSMTERMRDVRKLVYKNEYYGDKKNFLIQ